ncbi:hypothetical protein K435DRAFT_899698 [Dendrothele bispora CBS 962.96]|uniref:Cytochrome P450 n=1 Tax=Dendrothele bispora (strain CBS 962.96) TaxID=1314807 RepID=A0A4S8LY08_DENBC|nr:hypothetical protein K435DRAFT_899698 [Dendrothele bispora CBS 962.96]
MVGSSRLPDFQDKDKLPYIDAILKETQRLYPSSLYIWNIMTESVAVMTHHFCTTAIDHCFVDDDIYKGYFIPKGRAILHNEKTYPEPMKFKPERF